MGLESAHGAETCPGSAQTPGNWFTARLADIVNWGRKNSLYPLPFATACCGIEFMAGMASNFDQARFGAEVVRFSPRQSDCSIVAGTISHKMAPVLRRIYDQMLEPKYVIAMGVRASSGGFYDNYATVQGIDTILPVDVYIPGCPPRPEAILDAIVMLQKKIERAPLMSPAKVINEAGDGEARRGDGHA